MAKITYLMISIIALNVALLFFNCNGWNSVTGQCTSTNIVPPSTIWDFVTNPTAVNGSNIWDVLFGSTAGLAAIAASVMIVGAFFLKTETPLYLGMALALVYPVYSWIKLYQNIIGSHLVSDPSVSLMFGVILISPIIIAYLFTLLDWGRNPLS